MHWRGPTYFARGNRLQLDIAVPAHHLLTDVRYPNWSMHECAEQL